MGRQQLGDAAAVRGRVDVQHACALEGFGQLTDALDGSGLDDALVVVEVLVEQGDTFEHGSTSRAEKGDDETGEPSSGQSISRAECRCLSGQVPRNAQCRRGGDGHGRGFGPGRIRRRASSCRSPTAAKARLTRCSPRAAASRRQTRVTGPLGDPVDAEWGVLPGGIAVIEMAQASGLALVARRNDPLRATHARDRRVDRGRAPRRVHKDSRRRRRERDDRRRTRRGRRAGLVVARNRSNGRVRRHDDLRRRGPRLRTAEGRDGRAGRAAHAAARPARRTVRGRVPASTSPARGRRSRGWPRRRPRRDRRARSCRASTSSPKPSASKLPSTGAHLAVTGEGRLDATEPRRQGRRRGARLERRFRRSRTSP